MGLGGGWNRNPITPDNEKTAYDAIYAALETGIERFDLADIYTYGKAEEVFGKVIKNNPGLRNKIIIQSKSGIMLGKGPGDSNIYNFNKNYLIQHFRKFLKIQQIMFVDAKGYCW